MNNMLSKDDLLKINNIVYDAGDEIFKIYDTSFDIDWLIYQQRISLLLNLD